MINSSSPLSNYILHASSSQIKILYRAQKTFLLRFMYYIYRENAQWSVNF